MRAYKKQYFAQKKAVFIKEQPFLKLDILR